MTKYKEPLVLSPLEWMPLREAFARVRAAVGRELAERDLSRHLQTKRLPSAARSISDDKETCERLAPCYWKGLWLQGDCQDVPGKVCVFGGGLVGSWYFFVSRAHLEKLYPAAGAASIDIEDDIKISMQPPGKKPRHDWKKHVGREVARRALAGKSMQTAPEMQSFCIAQWNWEPELRQMQRFLRILRVLFD